MTVAELIAKLQEMPQGYELPADMTVAELSGDIMVARDIYGKPI